MEIRMARGDLETRSFTLKNKDKTVWSTEPDEIYFTVKKTAEDHDFLFQKRVSDGTIVKLETGKYQFTIEPEDTDNFEYGTYEFDIEVVKNNSVKKTFCGKLVVTKEVTHHYNEVTNDG